MMVFKRYNASHSFIVMKQNNTIGLITTHKYKEKGNFYNFFLSPQNYDKAFFYLNRAVLCIPVCLFK